MTKLIQITIVLNTLFGILKYVETKGGLEYQKDNGTLFKLILSTDQNNLNNNIPWYPQHLLQKRYAVASATGIAESQQPVSNYQAKATMCYSCTNCTTVEFYSPNQCPKSFDISRDGKCVVFAVKYKYMNQVMYNRGCASLQGSCIDIVRVHEEANLDLLFCNECVGDRCNNVSGVSRAIPDVTTAFMLFIITPLMGQLTLS